MRRHQESIPPVRKERFVPIPLEEAFDLFTRKLDTWWPLATHSLRGNSSATVRFDTFVGGRVVEVLPDGEEHVWAQVITWDSPHRVVLAWHPTQDPEACSRVDVRFHSTEGGTIVTLVHDEWEEHGSTGVDLREGYESGWDTVLSGLSDKFGDLD